MDDWAKMLRLISTGQHSMPEIGRLVGVSRRTMDRALESDRPRKYERAGGGSSSDGSAPQVRVLLASTPTIPAPALAERVGWVRPASVFRVNATEIPPACAPRSPETGSFTRPAGRCTVAPRKSGGRQRSH